MRAKVPAANTPLGQQLPTHSTRLSSPVTVDWAPTGGEPLGERERVPLERGFAFDFGRVRIHDDGAAHRAARALDANAFTVGDHIAFADGKNSPTTSAGRRLLAHELGHVVQQHGGARPADEALVLGADHPSELEAERAARTVMTGGHAPPLTPAPAAVLQRDIVNDAAGNPVSYEFRVGNELDQSFAVLAQRLLGGGPLHARGLDALQRHALNRHGTVDDHERMFMAGLMDAANAAILAAAVLGPGVSVTFTIASITPHLATVRDLGRQTAPASVTGPVAAAAAATARGDAAVAATQTARASTAAETEITRNAGGQFSAIAAAVITFARAEGVPLTDVLTAMLAAASDSSPGDKVMAAAVYTIAVHVRSPTTARLLAGTLKVDALLPTAFAALPIPASVVAGYVTAAQGSGLKGDTMYMSTDFDITNLYHRSIVVHELEHAKDDSAVRAKVAFEPTEALESHAYLAQGRYLLDQMAAQAPAAQAATATRLATQVSDLALLGMFMHALSNRARFEPLLVAIGAAAAPPVGAGAIATLLGRGLARLQTFLNATIRTRYNLAAGAKSPVDGPAGESILDWIFRI